MHVSGFERDVCGFFAGRSISQGKIGYGDDQMGTGVSMSGEDSGRLKFDVRDAGTVFYEEYMLRAVLQDLQAAIGYHHREGLHRETVLVTLPPAGFGPTFERGIV